MTNVILTHNMSSNPSNKAAQKHATEQAKNVDINSHFLPVFIIMYIAIAIAAISTRPPKACEKENP